MKHIGFICFILTVVAGGARGTNLLVYNNGDSGPGSFRQAILDNNNLGGGNTIVFSNIVAGTITLTTGELLITNNATIIGPGADVLAVDGNAADRVFHVNNGVTVAISGLTITNGNVSGVRGGGITCENSTLTVSNCTISGNNAEFGGGMSIDVSTGTVANCSISGNMASYGAGIYNYYSTLTVSNCAINGNAGGAGGGFYDWGYSGSAALTVIASTLSSNSATATGGGIFNNGQYGDATLTIIASTLVDNSASYQGGGIYNFTCAPGSATLTVVACTFSGNSATHGGGIRNDAYSCPFFRSTIDGDSDIRTSTASGATLEIGDTILNAGALGENIESLSGTVISDGYNLSSDGAGGYLTAVTDQINTDPKLGPLADNGGSTKTMALFVGSPAIDAGNSFGLGTDQRGKPRYDNPNVANATGGDGADIGAYEGSELRIVNVQKTGNHLQLDFINWLGTNYEVQSRSDMVTGSWDSLGFTNAGNGGIATIVVSNAFGQSQQFYRIHPVQ
ncbi:MAG TPA: choice-of-anchor Q domain-containing protein [Verrucomicrobiae bacterium]|nr:choice-of-anchor Q domain-containing protein [Verrucomicrobiae bacterium]